MNYIATLKGIGMTVLMYIYVCILLDLSVQQ